MDRETNPRPKPGQLGYGVGPVAVAGGFTLICSLGLFGGGIGVLTNSFGPLETPAGIHASPTPSPDVAKKPDDGTGTSTAGPTAPPERESAPKKVQPTDTVYYIQWGDTLSQISLDSGVSVERLAEYNAIVDVDLIYADAILRVPYILIPGPENSTSSN